MAWQEHHQITCSKTENFPSKILVTHIKWTRKAAEQGSVDAQLSLARLYEMGRGVSKDLKMAAKWFKKAAEGGSYLGQANLGNMYHQGKGVLKDFKKAHAWFHIAAVQEDPHWPMATNSRLRLEAAMTVDQIKEARKLAKDYAQNINQDLLDLIIEAESIERKEDLLEAIHHSHVFRAKELIASGVDINQRYDEGTTPLMEALRSFSYDIARILISKGADVNASDNRGNTPVIIATTHALRLDIVESLIEQGADINVTDNEGNTPLTNIAKWADHFRQGDGNFPKDIDLAIKWYQLAASHGDEHSKNALEEIKREN